MVVAVVVGSEVSSAAAELKAAAYDETTGTNVAVDDAEVVGRLPLKMRAGLLAAALELLEVAGAIDEDVDEAGLTWVWKVVACLDATVAAGEAVVAGAELESDDAPGPLTDLVRSPSSM